MLYKLDGGLDHILVDEAQDTSPAQWDVIRALAEEFFAGAGAREVARTLFAVGDEKQSIYSFQGAAPAMFAETGQGFAAARAGARTLPWRHIPLTLSFRSVEPLLTAVDRIFADRPTRTPGVTASADPIRHIADRAGHAGLIEIWPTVKKRDAGPGRALVAARRGERRLARGAAGGAHRRYDRRLAQVGRAPRPRRTGRSAPATS